MAKNEYSVNYERLLEAKTSVDNAINKDIAIHTKVHAKSTRLQDKISDNLALFAGSWVFIISFCSFIAIWILINTKLQGQAFDPYPFILLNLMLSCLAAIQAPVILMSQNRQEARDRHRSEADYKINIKSEYEIKLLQTKLDKLLEENTNLFMQHQQQLQEIKEAQSILLNKLNSD